MKHESIKAAWEVRNKLHDEGDRLRIEGGKLRAKGDKLRTEGSDRYTESRKRYTDAVVEKYGDDAFINWATGEITTH